MLELVWVMTLFAIVLMILITFYSHFTRIIASQHQIYYTVRKEVFQNTGQFMPISASRDIRTYFSGALRDFTTVSEMKNSVFLHAFGGTLQGLGDNRYRKKLRFREDTVREAILP